MKRSEMIDIIAKRLVPVGISEPTCEEVLTLMEEAGMLPPPSVFLVNDPQVAEVKNEWEPEDTIKTLQSLAANGDYDATIALARIQGLK